MSWLEDITGKITRRIPELQGQEHLNEVNDLIDDAFTQIIEFANANQYDVKWDNLLVNCAVALYNYQGNEGIVERKAYGVLDRYDSTDVLNDYLSRKIVPYIRPVGYAYSNDRFKKPE